ncbi:MAG: hypothetical protein UV68_C0043G0006 [Candidatus Collierbacteria bacterium GW2011_GWC2_43_12]|uniref:Uncharacterized protein n=1 Tax=Candidatus Collierbacteria bacterium GW2011_GWC2_43_12 TaxID=1618390 RepID=A0A0G1FBP4_9BACT|nr:MAG: hypothetical protein UV68_C0043G0006 [Candidatus Collierbacteria bacterium GW2011_GWC2_43_12]
MAEGLLNGFRWLDKKAGNLAVWDVDVLESEIKGGLERGKNLMDSCLRRNDSGGRSLHFRHGGQVGRDDGREDYFGVGAGEAAIGTHFGVVS